MPPKEKMFPADVEVERAEETEASDFPTASPDFCKFLSPPLSDSGIPGTVSVAVETLANLFALSGRGSNGALDFKTEESLPEDE